MYLEIFRKRCHTNMKHMWCCFTQHYPPSRCRLPITDMPRLTKCYIPYATLDTIQNIGYRLANTCLQVNKNQQHMSGLLPRFTNQFQWKYQKHVSSLCEGNLRKCYLFTYIMFFCFKMNKMHSLNI